MNLAELAVRRPQLTLLAVGLMAALGVSAFLAIPRAEDPSFPIPTYVVVAVLPGASPEDLEELVAEPLEDTIRELEDLKTVVSIARAGVVQVRAEFESGVDADEKYADVLREVERTRPELPGGLVRLDVERARTSNVAVIQLALVSETASDAVLEHEAERIERRLDAVPGARRADVWAVPEREVRVALDLERLGAHHLSADRVISALSADGLSVPAGTVDVGARSFGVTTDGTFAQLADVRSAVVAASPSGLVHLADVADVRLGSEDRTHVGRFRGQRAAFITLQLAAGENVFAVRDRAYAILDELEPTLAQGVRLERGFDQSRNVERRLDRLYEDFGLAILLVLITLLPLGLRAAGVVMVSIPLSLALGVAALHALGYSLNQLSIVGFVIALGLLVDDSIVVVENITRFQREGMSRVDAAIAASRQIGAAVLGCTATLVFAFVPLLFLPGGSGDFIRSLPVAVIVTVAASLVVALTATPFLASRMLPKDATEHGNIFLRGMHWLIEASYGRVLERALAWPRTTLLLAGGLFVASLFLVPVIGFSLFPKAGTPQFLIRVETPEGVGLEETDRAVRFVERALQKRGPRVAWSFSNVGRGNPQVYYNLPSHPEDERFGELFVELSEATPRETVQLLDGLRAELDAYPAARIQVVEFENGPPVEAPIAIRAYADELDTLSSLSRQIAQVVEGTPGTRDVVDPVRLAHTELEVTVDRDRAGMLGVPVASVARTVRLALAGLDVGALREASGDEHRIRITSPRGARAPITTLDTIQVGSLGGLSVPLGQIANTHFDSSAPLVQRRDGERVVTVTANVVSGANVEAVTRRVEAGLEAIPRPPGARIQIAGERETRSESFGGLGSAIVVAIFGILAILVVEFRTFKSTLIVATVIPLGFVGGVALLWATGWTLSFTAIIGFVALVGIEIKNSILLVDYTNQLRKEGVPLDEAIKKAGEVRFLPIVLTTATALGGLVPLAVQGSALYAPLAVVICGGLISSTVLARLVTPVAYRLLAPSV